MRSCRLSKLYIVIACVAAAAAFGCGGDDDDGGGGGGVDASVSIDAPAQLDAPNAELTGLGQSCDPAMQGADCPAEANGCLTFGQGATAGICTKLCLQTGSFTTDAQSQPGPFDPDPATMNSVCTAIYTGTVGAGVCAAIVNITPAPPLQADTDYTFAAACAVQCGANNTCPSGLTCNAQSMLCQP